MSSKEKKAPRHVSIIMGGNENWSLERNLPILDAYKKGYEKIRVMPAWFFNRGINIVSFLVFSSEDWKRPREEINSLMKYFKNIIINSIDDFKKNGWRVVMTGKIDELPGDLPELCNEFENETKDGNKGILNICLNYGGREELIQAFKKMLANNVIAEQIHEGLVRKYLFNNEIEDPDIIVRFGGEQNLGGFQLWQGANSELIFFKKDWPDFEPIDVDTIVKEYINREENNNLLETF
jgi:undecaprenyl diphosphate synthase